MLTRAYDIIFDCSVGAPGHVIEAVDGLKYTDKLFLSMFTTTVQLPVAAAYASQMEMHTSTVNIDISPAR